MDLTYQVYYFIILRFILKDLSVAKGLMLDFIIV